MVEGAVAQTAHAMTLQHAGHVTGLTREKWKESVPAMGPP